MPAAGPPTVDVPESIRAYALRELRSWGTPLAARRLGIAERTAIRVAAGLPVTRGTLETVREAMRDDPTVREAAGEGERWESVT